MSKPAGFKPTLATLSAVAAMLLLSACSSVAPDPFLTTNSVEPEAPAIATDVAPEFAAAYLPSLAGGIHSVRQTVRSDYLSQDIIYANMTALAGENRLSIEVGPPQQGGLLRPPSEAAIRREMRATLPGLAASISPVIGQNVNGTYGYATAANGATGACIYAWQFIKAMTPADSSGIGRLTRSHLSASIRLRYCHPSIPADRIHVLMDGVRVKDINGQTIDMLRFAANSAQVSAPEAVLTPPPLVLQTKRVVRRREVQEVQPVADDDWKNDTRAVVTPDSPSATVEDAVAVPLPESDSPSVKVTVPATDDVPADVAAGKITDAVDVPLPQ
jgi:hypothetical protein